MAYDYENYKKFYNAMNDTQRAKWAESNKNDADFNDFMSRYNSDSNATKSYVTPKQSNYQSQWEWNYVYNEKTWYYENQTNTSKNTVNQWIAPQPETKQEVIKQAPTKQQETVITTDTKNNQRGALTPASNEYYQQTSDEALNKIRNNLNQYRQTNPEYFSDYDSFKKNFSYDLRNDEQKNVLDTWYTGYSKWLELSSTPTTDLYTQYQSWEISVNDLENLRISNPTKYAELMTQINKWNIISAYDDDKGTTFTNFQDLAYQLMWQAINSLTKSDSWASQYFSDYEEKMNSPEMLDLQDKTTGLQEQIENIQDQIATMTKDVENEYEWTGASKSKINAIIADRTYDLQLQLRSLNSEYNKYATQYNNRATQYQNEFNLQLQEYQLNMQARNQQMSELWFAMDLMNFETNEQKAQREWDYWVKQQEYTNGNINSSNYQTRYKAALKSVENLLSNYEWIPMVRSAEQMAEDILTGMSTNGTTLWEELSKINKQIQQKPEYKKLYNATYWTSTSSAWIQDTMKIWDTEWVKYNDQWYTADDFNKMFKNWWWTGNAKPYDIVDESVFRRTNLTNSLWSFLMNSKNKAGQTGWWCGAYVNDYLQEIWATSAGNRYYDNELSTKLNSINTYDPKVWSIAVFDYGHITAETGKNHGHVGIVTQVYEDGSFDVMDSNYNSDKKIQKRHIQAGSSSLKWFFDPSKAPIDRSGTSTSSNLSEVDLSKKLNYLEEARRWQMTNTDISKIWNVAAEQWWGDEWREALKQGQEWNLTDTQTAGINKADDRFSKNIDVQDFDKAKNQFRQLAIALNDTSWVWDMSAIFTFMKTLDPTSVVRESEFEAAANTIWYANWDAILQKLEKATNWEFLTDKQREQFKTVAKEFIKIKADSYQKQYDNLAKKYQGLWVDINEWWPVNTAQELLNLIDGKWTTTTTNMNYSTGSINQAVSALNVKFWLKR